MSNDLFAGIEVGYDRGLGDHLLVGLEADLTFPYFASDGRVASIPTSGGASIELEDLVATLRGRAGYAGRSWLLYATAGPALAQARLQGGSGSLSGSDQPRLRTGLAAGAGAELVLTPSWRLRLEYRLDHLGGIEGDRASGVSARSTGLDVQTELLGLEWRVGGDTAADRWWRVDPANLSVHAQTTFVEQGYFAFRSPYEGANSLSGSTQFAHTLSATAFVGGRVWRGGEVYVNPEIDQGSGLNGTLGVAGFPNGEAQKASFPYPRVNVDRAFLRQTFDLGGERIRVADGPNRVAATVDASRLVVTVGRFSVGDIFFQNAYASDPRTQFLNWNVYGGGSYDWTMDRPGWTWGASVELVDARWALRAGYFLETTISNGDSFDTNVPVDGQYVVEPELRYTLLGQPGAVRVFGWVTHANMGSYTAALAMPPATPGYPDITLARRPRFNYGLLAGVAQALGDDIGVFSRVSYSPGLVEIMGWTDCDQSASLGAVMTGRRWRRPADTVGLAGLVEALSSEARAYFAAGGLGILVGDGHMSYRPEQILEAYYSLAVTRGAWITLDYQLVGNPAYNADRGPVSVYAVRVHVEQ